MEQDIYLQYITEKIDRYERQLKGVSFHLSKHKEILRRLETNPQIAAAYLKEKPVQLTMFGHQQAAMAQ